MDAPEIARIVLFGAATLAAGISALAAKGKVAVDALAALALSACTAFAAFLVGVLT